MELRRIPIYRALNRPNLLFGAERELILSLGLAGFALAVVAQNILALVLAIFLWTVGSSLLRMMGKADPMMSRVYLRHVKYRGYYAARSRAWRRE